MAFSNSIQDALHNYDKNKGFFRKNRWLSWLFGRDAPAIRALRALQPDDQENIFEIFNCFIKNGLKKTQASYSVFNAFIQDQFFKASPPSNDHSDKDANSNAALYLEIGVKLNKAKIFNASNIQAIQPPLNLKKLAAALQILDKEKNLNQNFFNTIIKKKDPLTATKKLLLCKKKLLLNDQNRNISTQHYDSLKIIRVMLEKTNINFYEHFATISTHPYLTRLCITLQELDAQYGLASLSTHPCLTQLCTILQELNAQYDLASLIPQLFTKEFPLLDFYHKLIIQKNRTYNGSITSANTNKTESSNQPPSSSQLCTQLAPRRNVLFKLCSGDESSIENENGPSGENVTKSLFSGQKTH